jgi:hypothetical protein
MVDLSSLNCSGLLIHGTQLEHPEFCGNQNQNSESCVISILIDSESEFYILKYLTEKVGELKVLSVPKSGIVC